jgi:hypothetical protein
MMTPRLTEDRALLESNLSAVIPRKQECTNRGVRCARAPLILILILRIKSNQIK